MLDRLPCRAKHVVRAFVTAAFIAHSGAGATSWAQHFPGAALPAFLQTRDTVLEPASCGVHRTLWIEHYVAALYLPRDAMPQALLDPTAPKAVLLKIVEARYLPERIPSKWSSALQTALDRQTLDGLEQAYSSLDAGDVVAIEYVPRDGTVMRVNGRVVAKAAGHRVVDAILTAWAVNEGIDRKLQDLTANHRCD